MSTKSIKGLFIAVIVLFMLPLLVQGQTPTPTVALTPTTTCGRCPMNIGGYVKNAAGEPVVGAEVEVSSPGALTVTNDDGSYFVTAIGLEQKTGCPAGDHYIWVRAQGYLKASRFVPSRCGSFGYDFTLAVDPAYGLLGDVNGSSEVDILDALMIARYVVGYNDAGFNATLADVDENGIITIVDALIVAQYDVGLIIQLPPA